MKVLVLAPPLARAGGIQRYTVSVVRALGSLLGERNVCCLAIREDSGASRAPRLSAGAKVSLGWKALHLTAGWRPELILCTHLALGPVGRLLAGLAKRPYWIVVHGIEAWSSLPKWKAAALIRAERVIVTSAFSREQVLNRHQIDPQRISSLPCTLDERLLAIRSGGQHMDQSLSDGQRVVLTVARMAASERYKGHDVVLRALPSVIARVPNLRYVVVGDGDDRERLEILARELGVTEHVSFTGEISDSELADLYRRSELFVLPARTVIDAHNPKGEGFGIAFLEAMAFGKPVIGPDSGAPAELIRHGQEGLLVDPGDPRALANAVINLLTTPEVARNMGDSASRRVRQEYSFSALRRRLGEILVESGYLTFNPLDQAVDPLGVSLSSPAGVHS
jgi:phosphatidyl-myo-inositol dimannoside synthase